MTETTLPPKRPSGMAAMLADMRAFARDWAARVCGGQALTMADAARLYANLSTLLDLYAAERAAVCEAVCTCGPADNPDPAAHDALEPCLYLEAVLAPDVLARMAEAQCARDDAPSQTPDCAGEDHAAMPGACPTCGNKEVQ